MPKSCSITQSNYIPWKGYFDQINMVDEFIIYDCVQYTKNDWRNRNKIKTSQGAQWLTVPVSLPHGLKTRIDEALIADNTWAEKHWRALCCNYSRSAHFETYNSALDAIYKTQFSGLSEANMVFLKYFCDELSISTRITSAVEYELHEERNMRLVNLCRQVNATIYYSGPRAANYLNVDLFTQHGIEVRWMDYSGYPEYTQLFGPFEESVTMLDLLLNEGPNSRKFMKSFSELAV